MCVESGRVNWCASSSQLYLGQSKRADHAGKKTGIRRAYLAVQCGWCCWSCLVWDSSVWIYPGTLPVGFPLVVGERWHGVGVPAAGRDGPCGGSGRLGRRQSPEEDRRSDTDQTGTSLSVHQCGRGGTLAKDTDLDKLDKNSIPEFRPRSMALGNVLWL